MLRGPLGGSRQWTLLWAVLLGVRLLRRVTRSEPEVVFTETLRPGESLLIAGGERAPTVVGGHDTSH
jgi:hypothetical protein